MPTKLRVGAVSYLNTKPLVYRLEHYAPHVELSYDLPSRLADDLSGERLDVALIPSIEYFQDPTYTIVSDACIACRGAVLSVKLLTRVPFEEITSLALDEGSRTSVALARILLRERYEITPHLEPFPIGTEVVATTSDAVLLIGDRAIDSPRGDFVAEWDLGQEWCQWSALPMVFAMWVARSGVDVASLRVALEQARDDGVRHLQEIAAKEASGVRLSPDACLTYLRDNLHFYFGPREQRGLELFRGYAASLGMAPKHQLA